MPTTRLVLPTLQACKSGLNRINQGGEVDRGFMIGTVRPHHLSTVICGAMGRAREETFDILDLHLTACVLHPYLREMHFVRDVSLREQYKIQGQSMVRSLLEASGGPRSSRNEPQQENERNATTDSVMDDYHTSRKAGVARSNAGTMRTESSSFLWSTSRIIISTVCLLGHRTRYLNTLLQRYHGIG